VREDAENRKRKKQPTDANARDTFPRSSLAFRCKESDDGKNESTGDDRQGNGSEQEHLNRAYAKNPG
jgi:hypothetical protein